MVKRTSWLFPKEQVQVQFLVGVLKTCFDGETEIIRSSEGRVPGSNPDRSTVAEPRWIGELVVSQNVVGPTPTGHPERKLAMLDGSSAALLKRTKWVRVPPLALFFPV